MAQTLFSLRSLLAGVFLSSIAALGLAACESAGSGGVESEDISGADESGGEELSGSVAVGSQLQTTANVNFRSGPSTSGSVYRVLPEGTTVEVVKGSPSGGFYNVKHNGKTGWVSGKYLADAGEGEGDSESNSDTGSSDTGAVPADGKAGAMARAKSVDGFSYWWGHGRWRPEGVTNSTRGDCNGSCGACTHSGSYGADCSGFIAKVWQVPSGNDDITVDDHPYGTADFYNGAGSWSTVNRDSIKQADALVYRSGSKGHIMLYSSGDGWGSFNAYECKGCDPGCLGNLRKVGSSYKTIRRKGW